MLPEKGDLVFEDEKIKIFNSLSDENLSIIETHLYSSAKASCNIFRLLQAKGIPVAYIRSISYLSFLSQKYDVLPIKLKAIRYARGDYLDRRPEFRKDNSCVPYKFNNLEIEFFLKTQDGVVSYKGKDLIKNLKLENLLVSNPSRSAWILLDPSKAYDDKASFVNIFDASEIIHSVNLFEIERITRDIFLILERVWGQLKYILVNLEIEFGITSDGKLVVSSIIDNDSMELVSDDWKDLFTHLYLDKSDPLSLNTIYSKVYDLDYKF